LASIGGAILVLTAPSGQAATGPEPPNAGATQRTLGWVGIGSGVALAGAGVVMRVLAASDPSTVTAPCGVGDCSAVQRPSPRETASNWAFGVGAALAATGTILELTAPSAKSPTVALGPSGVLMKESF
jgi:hypothetical protein